MTYLADHEDAVVSARIAAVPYWFHQIEVRPGIVTPGPDESATKLKRLAIPEDLTGKTVLDVGAYDGFFTFECERRGATVVAIDFPQSAGYPVAADLVGSPAKFVELSVYDVSPETVGEFDIVLFLGVLYHLRHPLLALERLRTVCRELLIVESQICEPPLPSEAYGPVAQFFPGAELNNDPSNWWVPNMAALKGMLQSSGFEQVLAVQQEYRACVHAIPSLQ